MANHPQDAQAVEREAAVPGEEWERTQLARAIESVLLRRAYKGELDGYTLVTSYECADAVRALATPALRPPQPGVVTEELREALLGDPDMPDCIRPLGWLHTMIGECKRMHELLEHAQEQLDDEFGDEDPEAFWEMVREVQALHDKASLALLAAPSPGASVTASPADGEDHFRAARAALSRAGERT